MVWIYHLRCTYCVEWGGGHKGFHLGLHELQHFHWKLSTGGVQKLVFYSSVRSKNSFVILSKFLKGWLDLCFWRLRLETELVGSARIDSKGMTSADVTSLASWYSPPGYRECSALHSSSWLPRQMLTCSVITSCSSMLSSLKFPVLKYFPQIFKVWHLCSLRT